MRRLPLCEGYPTTDYAGSLAHPSHEGPCVRIDGLGCVAKAAERVARSSIGAIARRRAGRRAEMPARVALVAGSTRRVVGALTHAGGAVRGVVHADAACVAARVGRGIATKSHARARRETGSGLARAVVADAAVGVERAGVASHNAGRRASRRAVPRIEACRTIAAFGIAAASGHARTRISHPVSARVTGTAVLVHGAFVVAVRSVAGTRQTDCAGSAVRSALTTRGAVTANVSVDVGQARAAFSAVGIARAPRADGICRGARIASRCFTGIERARAIVQDVRVRDATSIRCRESSVGTIRSVSAFDVRIGRQGTRVDIGRMRVRATDDERTADEKQPRNIESHS